MSSIGASTVLQVTEGAGVNPEVTPGIATQPSGSTIVVGLAGWEQNNPSAVSDNKGNGTFSLIGSENFYAGGSFSQCYYIKQNAAGGSGHTFSVPTASYPAGEITVFPIEIIGGGAVDGAMVIQAVPSAGDGNNFQTVSITTTTDNCALIAWIWGEGNGTPHIFNPDGAWLKQQQATAPTANEVQGAMATRIAGPAGTYSITWANNNGVGLAETAVIAIVAIQSGDATAPVLSSPTGTVTGSSTATVGATTDEANGTMYAVVDTVTTTPSAAELEAGQDGDGGAAVWSGSQAITTTGAKTFNVTGLAPNTAYTYFIGHKDATGNFSNIVSGTFTTYQRSGPASDVSAGAWTSSLGGVLAAAIDETSPDEADYIQTATLGDVCTVALGTLTDPALSTGHQLSYRIGGDGVSGIQVDLMQGGTVIATWTHDPAPSLRTTFVQTLTGTQADSITDYTALRLRFTEI